MPDEPVYTKPDNIVFREEEDGAILFNADDGSVFLLEHLGWALYSNHLEQGVTRAQMLESLKTHYPDQDPSKLETDLDDFLAKLEAAGCIEKAGGG